MQSEQIPFLMNLRKMYWIISFEIVFLVQDPSILVKIITSLFGVMVCSFITLFWTSPTIWLEFKHFLTILSRETIGVPIYVSLLRTMFVVVTCFVGRRVLDIDPMGCYTIIASNFHRSLSPWILISLFQRVLMPFSTSDWLPKVYTLSSKK